MGNTTFFNAYVEMVSCLTTTGATLYDDPGRLAPPLHTWRATVGWLGGLIMWVGAIAVLAPMALGGFEVRMRAPGSDVNAIGYSQITERADLSRRIRTHAAVAHPGLRDADAGALARADHRRRRPGGGDGACDVHAVDLRASRRSAGLPGAAPGMRAR